MRSNNLKHSPSSTTSTPSLSIGTSLAAITSSGVGNSLKARFNIEKTRFSKPQTNTMTNKINHRKVRSSREYQRKLVEFINNESNAITHRTMQSTTTITTKSTPFPGTRHIGRSLWQSVKLITLLTLFCCSIKVSFAIVQRSHSSTGTVTLTSTPLSSSSSASLSTSPAAAAFTLPWRANTNSRVESPDNGLITITSKYSRPFAIQPYDADDGDSFRPIIPKDINLETISQNVFTKDGKYRVFETVDSDLRATLSMKRKDNDDTHDPLTLREHDRKSFPFSKQAKRETLLSKHPIKTSIKSKHHRQQSDDTPNSDNRNKSHQTQKTYPKIAPTASNVTHDTNTTMRVKSFDEQHPPHDLTTIDGQQVRQTTDKKQFPSSTYNHPRTNKTNSITAATTTTTTTKEILAAELKDLENLLAEYLNALFNNGRYQPKPELVIALQKNLTEMKQGYEHEIGKFIPKSRTVRQAISKTSNDDLSLNIPRTLESGRLLFFAGLKKVMWPLYMGLQVLKSLMLALLLPTIIGSFGKLLGKGISSGSAPLFIRPMDEPQDLDFRDNNFNFDDDSNKFTLIDDAAGSGGNVKDTGYAYNQAEASQAHNQYAYNAAALNQQALSRYSLNERQQLMQDSYLSALQSLGAASFKNSGNLLSGSSSSGGLSGLAGLASPMTTRQKPAPLPANMNTFQQFQKVPASSLLLSNYDPFYSPLLSRLDSVFAQLKLNSDDEACREKLICLMYANPAKYAPYSNLVSAQLSRELNELRKPTSDNPDILRFFKYMRAAKDGQDGVDCEKTFDKCKEFKDFENPAMVSTYHDINKLVQARKFS